MSNKEQKEMYRAFLDRDCDGKTLLQRIKMYQTNKIMKLKWARAPNMYENIIHKSSLIYNWNILNLGGYFRYRMKQTHEENTLPFYRKTLRPTYRNNVALAAEYKIL